MENSVTVTRVVGVLDVFICLWDRVISEWDSEGRVTDGGRGGWAKGESEACPCWVGLEASI